MKIPQEMADFFEKHIAKHPELSLKFVSQYVLKVLREHIEDLLELRPSREKTEKTISLQKGEYTKEELQKLLENMRE